MAAKRRDADPAGQEHCRARGLPREGHRAVGALEKKLAAEWQRIESAFERGGAQARGHHQITFMGCAGNGESASIAFQIRVACAKESKIDELSCLEFEIFGLLKIERSGARTNSFIGLQAYFVGWHRFLVAYSFRCAKDARG